MATLRYRVVALAGLFIGDDFYPTGTQINLSTPAARYLVSSGVIALAGVQAPTASTPTAPTEDDIQIAVTVSGTQRYVTLTSFIAMFPSLTMPATALDTAIAGVVGDANATGNTLGKLQGRVATLEARPDPSNIIDGLCDVLVSGERIVRSTSTGIRMASCDAIEDAGFIVGLSLQAGPANETIQIQMSGPVSDPSWSFTPGPIWLGTYGRLVQTPPTAGFSKQVALALSPTKILLGLKDSIILG